MTGDRIPANLLSVQLLANPPRELRRQLALPETCRSLGLISADSDDAAFIALDEATKAAAVDVVYARSLYAGAKNATTQLAGEVIGILGGENPAEVQSGLRAVAACLRDRVCFRSANAQDSVVYLAHCVGSAGRYLSRIARIPQGQALAYLIAPPVEALVGLDCALKAAAVHIAAFYAPPTETNFAGALLAGTQSACRAACDAFAAAVCAVAETPNTLQGGNKLGFG